MSTAIEEQESIDQAIEGSRWILALGNDWDDQGAVGYEQSTWERACEFLRKQASLAHRKLDGDLPAPKILPGPEGSIDLHWKMPNFEVLVNVPSDPRKPGSFYGDDYGDLSIRGTLNIGAEARGLIAWFLR